MADRSAVFLDRDGTLIEDTDYPTDPDLVRLLPGVVEGLGRLTAAGFLLVVVSNQSGIGRGIVTPEQASAVQATFIAEFAGRGIVFAGSYSCPHGPDEGCPCRKPSPGMLLDAAADLGIDLASSFIVGDKGSDATAGRRAGCRAILMKGRDEDSPDVDFVAGNWREAVDFILDARVPA